jgi:predicted RNA binding protein YcfA (HicA-like mRNA interferase family)
MSDAKKLATQHGFQFWKMGKGSHQLWRHPKTGQIVTLAKNLSGRNVANLRAELRRKAQV